MFQWLEHTGELELAIEADTPHAVFADAVRAFGELVGEGEPAERTSRELCVQSSDMATLLADWLNELTFLADTEAFVPEELEAVQLTGPNIRGKVIGHTDEPRPLVKAVTYHDLVFEPAGGRWRARVVLDV